jgi:hypothetical protein
MSLRKTRNKTAKKHRGGDLQSWWSSTVNPASAPSSEAKPLENEIPAKNEELALIKTEIQKLSDRVSTLEKSPSLTKTFGGKSKKDKSKKNTHK